MKRETTSHVWYTGLCLAYNMKLFKICCTSFVIVVVSTMWNLNCFSGYFCYGSYELWRMKRALTSYDCKCWAQMYVFSLFYTVIDLV